MRKVPKLRFKEFSGEWEEYPLGKIMEISKEKFNPAINLTNQICIELEHISSENGELLGFVDSNNQKSIKNKFKENQIIYGKLRPYLKKYWLAKFDGVCSSEFWVLNGEKIENKYLYFFIQTEKFNQIANVSSGSKMPRADWNYMSLFEVFIPHSIAEQLKIASFLTSIDKKMKIVAEKIKHLESYKKGLMQKLLTGEIRFSGFNDEWKEEKLGNICNITTGSSKSKYIDNDGLNCIIDMGSISSDGKLLTKKRTNINKDYLKYGTLIMPKDDIGGGQIIGKVAFINEEDKYILGDHVFAITVINNNSLFLYYLINSNFINKELKRKVTGSAQLGLNKSNVENILILIPSLQEQQKIASFLTAIDKKIELNKNKLENLRIYKKGLLQKMFI